MITLLTHMAQAIAQTATLPGQQRRLHADSAAIVTARGREKRSAAAKVGWVTRRENV